MQNRLIACNMHVLSRNVQHKIESLLFSLAPFPLKINALDFYVTARRRFQSSSVMSPNSVTLELDNNSIAICALKSLVTPTFLSRNALYLQLSLHCPKMNKKSMCEGKRNSGFLSARHRILPSCGCKAPEMWSLNANLLFEEPHQLTKFA